MTLEEVRKGSMKYIESHPLPPEGQERIKVFKPDAN